MRRTVYEKRPKATVEENIAYLLDKTDCLLRKVEIYDRALNEFSQIKLTIDEATENTRKSKDMVKEAKEASNIQANDITTLVKLIQTLTTNYDFQIDSLKKIFLVLSDRVTNHREELDQEIEKRCSEIREDMNSLLTTNDWLEINKKIDENKKYFESLISNVHDNAFKFSNDIEELFMLFKESQNKHEKFRKDLCIFQNALVRKGVPIDN